MEDIEKLKRRLIENQDIIFYFAYNSYIEMLFYGDVDLEFPIQPVNLADFIKDNPDVIDGLQMRNIVNLLAISSKESFPFDIEQIILKKLENGERFFSGNNFESNAFGNIQTSFDMAFNSNLISDDTANFIKQKIYADLDRLKEKDLEAANLINNAKTIYAIDNFINTYQKGWTREKQEVLEELCRENINVLDIINYEIFEDEFFNSFSPEFVKHIAKYPNESSKLLIIKRNYPELFEAEKKMILEFEKEPMPEKYALEKKVNAHFYGHTNYDIMMAYLYKSDIAVNPIIGKSVASIINKVCDYATAGIPVINSQNSEEYRTMIDKYKCGINCNNGDVKAFSEAILKLYNDEKLRKEMRNNSLKMAEENFNREKTYFGFIEAIEYLSGKDEK